MLPPVARRGRENGTEEAVGGVSSVRRALDLLFCFTQSSGELSLSELARRCGLEAATTHRLAATLVDAGLLAQDRARGNYRLGLRVLELGFSVLDAIEVRRVAFPYLVAFHGQTHPRSASSLLIPDGPDMLNVERLPPREWSLLFTPQLGYRFPVHASAAGKAYLAALPDDERQAFLQQRPLERYTPHTETDAARLEAEIARVCERGYGTSDEEAVLGSRAVAAAILQADGRPVGAILAQAAAAELSAAEMAETIAPRIVGVAAQVSAALGYRRLPRRA